jgi:hypothetical protein
VVYCGSPDGDGLSSSSFSPAPPDVPAPSAVTIGGGTKGGAAVALLRLRFFFS